MPLPNVYLATCMEKQTYGRADFKTNFGIDYRNDYSYSMTKNNPEFSESGGQNNFYESNYFNYRWVWTNTLSFSRTFNEIHSLNILLGTELFGMV